jgi:glycerophosphoryl diester phosphodiesterase
LAIELGSDYIEPDVVVTKDRQLVALHDLLLDQTTNIAQLPQFVGRRTTKVVEGGNMTGFFVDDFTLDELRSVVRLRQRLADTRTTMYDYLFTVPTLAQVFELAQNATLKYERQVGVYMELKHPQYYAANGVNMEDLALAALRAGGYETKGVVANLMGKTEPAPVVIQCFDPRTLVSLRTKCDLPLVQLVPAESASSLWTLPNLDAVQSYANGVGPPLSLFTAAGVEYARGAEMMAQAAERNLVVHPWQLQSEKKYVGARFGGSTMKESLYFVCCLETQVRRVLVHGFAGITRARPSHFCRIPFRPSSQNFPTRRG